MFNSEHSFYQVISEEQGLFTPIIILLIFPIVKNEIKYKRVLITGGTSGLGKSLVSQFLSKGVHVVVIGRNSEKKPFNHPNYLSLKCDFASLEDIKKVVAELKKADYTFNLLINNAGVLSPPKFQHTIDGFEFSYQVNFLSHVLLTRLLLKNGLLYPGLVVNVSSPIYRLGKLYADISDIKSGYGIFQAYSNTKLYMALFSKKLAEGGISSFSFNPGTFSSGIYRMQKKWFHVLYRIASPFMTSSADVGKALMEIIANESWPEGEMINKKGKIHYLNRFGNNQKSEFWEKVDNQLQNFLM